MPILNSLNYDRQYYEEHKAAGLDYLGHGFWQDNYAHMVSEVTLQSTYTDPCMFDGGCACGSILKGFKDTKIYNKVVGMDLSDHMATIGREHFNFHPDELICRDMSKSEMPDNYFSLVHSAQVLEHVPHEDTEPVVKEFFRILRPNGRAFFTLDAVREGEDPQVYMGDPTHVNIKPIEYWNDMFKTCGFTTDTDGYERFKKNNRGPYEHQQEEDRTYHRLYPYWSVWVLIKN